jgi:hypothetical protein
MTRPGSRRRHPAAVIALATVVLVAADAAAWLLWAAWHLMPYLLALAVAGIPVWALTRRRRPEVSSGSCEVTDADRLLADVQHMRRLLAQTTATLLAAEQAATRKRDHHDG